MTRAKTKTPAPPELPRFGMHHRLGASATSLLAAGLGAVGIVA